MMKFSTYTQDKDGTLWSAEPISAISWSDAEYQAELKGVTIRGRLHKEIITDDNGVDRIIDYDIIENN